MKLRFTQTAVAWKNSASREVAVPYWIRPGTNAANCYRKRRTNFENKIKNELRFFLWTNDRGKEKGNAPVLAKQCRTSVFPNLLSFGEFHGQRCLELRETSFRSSRSISKLDSTAWRTMVCGANASASGKQRPIRSTSAVSTIEADDQTPRARR